MKRQLSPREQVEEQNSKKHVTAKMANSTGDVFSWEMMRNLLDDTLEDVVKKDDLRRFDERMDRLEAENLRLKEEVLVLNSRLEQIDRKSRTGNIVVNGLKSKNSNDAKAEFAKLASEVLKVTVDVTNAVMLNKTSFMFTLDTISSAQKVLAASGLLKGRTIYLQKDFTKSEQNIRYKLRQITKSIKEKNKTVKIRHGDFCIFLNDMRFTLYNDKISAKNDSDATFLKEILKECNISYEVIVYNSLSKNLNSQSQ